MNLLNVFNIRYLHLNHPQRGRLKIAKCERLFNTMDNDPSIRVDIEMALFSSQFARECSCMLFGFQCSRKDDDII